MELAHGRCQRFKRVTRFSWRALRARIPRTPRPDGTGRRRHWSGPLLLAAKEIPESSVYLGYTGVPFAVNGFHEISRNVTVKSGGTIVDAVDPSRYDTIFACGPVAMMYSLAQKAEGTNAKLYVSIEKRMGAASGLATAAR